MSWVLLILAGLFEIGLALGLKYSHGFTKLWPSVFTTLSAIISMWLLALAMKNLPVGTAYAVWTGIGSIGTVVLGITLFGDSASVIRLFCVALILAGIVGLKLVH